MRLCYRFLAAIAVLILFPAVARGGYVGIQLAAAPDGYSCEIADPGPNGLVTVYVILRTFYYDTHAEGVGFSAPPPPNSGLTYVTQTSDYTVTGSPDTYAYVGFGQCLSEPVVIMTLYLQQSSTGDPCTLYRVSSDNPIYVDCSFAEQPMQIYDGVAVNSDGHCNPVPIRNPSPADGATNAPLTVDLSWEDAYYVCNAPLAASAGSGVVYFGKTTNPPFNEAITQTHTAGPLEPNTTYYWKVYNDYPSWWSPVWSFTTTDKVAVKTSTWGAIKALYR